MRPHEKLKLWKRAIEFVVRLYKATNLFQRGEVLASHLRFDVQPFQFRQISLKVQSRQSDKEFLNFLSIAQGSATELSTSY